MRLTPDEMQKFQRAVELQKQEIWEKSKKNRYKQTWYYKPPVQERVSFKLKG